MSDFTPPNRPRLGVGRMRRFRVVIDGFVEIVKVEADDAVSIEGYPDALDLDMRQLSNHMESHDPSRERFSWAWLEEL
jgi:hypothetical protein